MNHRQFTAALAVIAACGAGAGVLSAKEYPDWDGYPPMFSMNGVIEFEGSVYGTTKGGVFKYNPETRAYTLYYKNHGLPSNDVLCVAATSDYLFFGFETAGLMRYDPKSELFEPLLFPEYAPNKIAVQSIYAHNDSMLYVAHSVGIDILNLSTREVRTITKLGGLAQNTPVNEVRVFNGKIWVCTPLGLAIADENNPNLDVEGSWKSYTYSFWGKTTGFNCIIHVKDEAEDVIYLGTQDRGIVWFDENESVFWETAVTEGKVFRMCPGMGKYWAATDRGLFYKYARFWSLKSGHYSNLNGVWSDSGRVWVSTLNDGLQCYADTGWVDIAPVPGPRSTKFSKIQVTDDGIVWATTAFQRGRRGEESGLFHRFQDGVWTTYSENDGFYRTPVSVVLDRKKNVWLSMWGANTSGVFVIQDDGTPVKKNDLIIPLDPKKEIFRPTIKSDYVVCKDITTDKFGNIWVSNFQLDQPDTEEGGSSHNLESVPTSGAVVLDGYPITRYRHFSPASGDIVTAKIFDICADNDGWVWMSTDKKGLMGLFVGDDPFDTTKATFKQHLMVADGLNSLRVKAVNFDRDGYIWVGTDAGLNRVTKLPDYRLKVDGMTQLLGTAGNDVNCIEVDPFNNKWIGTSNGLVKIDPENEKQEIYTTSNSGLFSNTILGLKYDQKTDLLWIGTDTGMNTFQVFGSNNQTAEREARVYPNPFSIWGSDSQCTFVNLKLANKVRIYTFNGVMVNELEAKETSAKGVPYVKWDGRNFKNEYVASGVYFFAGEDQNGRPFRDKMVIIRR
jgi:ligand-binding sensor domain-containing protein